MYFSALRKLIGSADEIRFYDVAILYLSAQRYRDLSIVDGSGDGGRDVTCSRSDLRIQLSVRRDWENKINEEAGKTAAALKKHLIYVTNRAISPKSEEAFRASKYVYGGSIDASIHDLNRISTALARPGRIAQAYTMLGASLTPTVQATITEIAISSVLLFGQEASELREKIIEANVLAWLLRHPNSPEDVLVDEVARALPGVNPVKAVTASISRLRSFGKIVGSKATSLLAQEEAERMQSAETEFLLAFNTDVAAIAKLTNLKSDDAEELVKRSMEILLRGGNFGNGEVDSESVRAFLAEKGLTRQKLKIYEALSQCAVAQHFQYASTVEQIFSTDTFDIYRALGGRAEINMVLDTSVALPMLFGLEFQVATSRYAVSASALLDVCRAHGIPIIVPRPYVNEMAAHGLKAVEFLERYEALPEDLKPFLRGSGNAYLSHYSHIHEAMVRAGKNVNLTEFLSSFGIKKNTSLRSVENRILSLLEGHGINTGMTSYYDADVRNQIAEAKPNEAKIVVDHDAAICTTLINDSSHGYILATWDKVMVDTVRDLARVYADSPAKVTDFLCAVEGIDHEYDRSTELLTTLLYTEEIHAENLARKIEAIRTPQEAFRLRDYIEEARYSKGKSWLPDVDDLTHFLDSSSPDEKSSSVEGELSPVCPPDDP